MAGAGTPGREGTPMLTVVPDVAGALPADGQPSSLIDQIVRDGARRMLAAALQAEVAAYIDQFAGLRDENGRRLVVRNGTAGPRTVLTSAGAVEVTAPRVNDKRTDPATGERDRFSSAILPPWARKTPQVSEVLPLLYLHGLSSGDFVPALGQFLGSHAGLSSSTVTRLTETWSAEAAAFMTRDLSAADYVYLWVDGIHLGIRLGEGKLCRLEPGQLKIIRSRSSSIRLGVVAQLISPAELAELVAGRYQVRDFLRREPSEAASTAPGTRLTSTRQPSSYCRGRSGRPIRSSLASAGFA